MDARDPELKRELDATLQTRKELGAEYEEELIASFLTKVEQRLDSAVETRVRRRLAEHQMAVARGGSVRERADDHPRAYGRGFGGHGGRLGLAIASLVLAVPLSAIAVVNAHIPGLLVCWAGIVGVNAVQAGRSWSAPAGSADAAGDRGRGGSRSDDWDRG